MTQALRTPEERFDGLPEFDFAPSYREAGGLRLAHLDEGDGAPVVFLHGEPTWSFLWRRVIPPVRDAGFRCRMSDAWLTFAAFVERTEDLPVSLLVRRGCATDPGDEIGAAYDAPFAEPAAKAGARAFPRLVAQAPDAPGAATGRRVLAALREDRRPMLLLWGEDDPALPVALGEAFARTLGRPPPRRIAGASHYLQEDKGPELGAVIADWLSSEPG